MAATHSRDHRHASGTLEAGGTLDPMDSNFAWLGGGATSRTLHICCQ